MLFFLLIGAALVSPDGFGASFVRNRDVSRSPAVVTAPPPVSRAAANGNKSQYLKTDGAGRVKAELVDFRYAAQSPDLRKDFDKLKEMDQHRDKYADTTSQKGYVHYTGYAALFRVLRAINDKANAVVVADYLQDREPDIRYYADQAYPEVKASIAWKWAIGY